MSKPLVVVVCDTDDCTSFYFHCCTTRPYNSTGSICIATQRDKFSENWGQIEARKDYSSSMAGIGSRHSISLLESSSLIDYGMGGRENKTRRKFKCNGAKYKALNDCEPIRCRSKVLKREEGFSVHFAWMTTRQDIGNALHCEREIRTRRFLINTRVTHFHLVKRRPRDRTRCNKCTSAKGQTTNWKANTNKKKRKENLGGIHHRDNGRNEKRWWVFPRRSSKSPQRELGLSVLRRFFFFLVFAMKNQHKQNSAQLFNSAEMCQCQLRKMDRTSKRHLLFSGSTFGRKTTTTKTFGRIEFQRNQQWKERRKTFK